VSEKHDAGKPRWSLLPAGAIRSVVDVLEHGARTYSVDNWQTVPDARRRYYDAAMRHIESWWSGEKWDAESGLPHLAHAACCVLFLMWFDSLGCAPQHQGDNCDCAPCKAERAKWHPMEEA
jgi:hypothetical protein